MYKHSLILLSILSSQLFGQNISGVINEYSAVTESGNCSNSLVINNPDAFTVGEDAIVIQMKGASINEENNANFGTISNYNEVGTFEKVNISGKNGDTLFFSYNLLNTYNFQGKVQLVTYPKYDNATVTSELIASPWNGSTGGVCAIQVKNTLTIDAPISVNSLGYRGGAKQEISNNNCSWLIESADFFYPNTSWESSNKGEGIAEFISGKEFGKGPQANGGGAGNDHNAGGAGGGNFGTGGLGGINDDPGTFNCRSDEPGLGGLSLNFTSNKAYLGGGGGAGHGNNSFSTGGGNGGGIIFISARIIEGSNQVISADGEDAENTISGDGAGGGGAGGTILLDISTLGTNLTLSTNGGKGGNTNNDVANRCFGPGGGGAGGFIFSSSSLTSITTSLTGGAPGIIEASTNGCNGNSNGALNGGNGSFNESFVFTASTNEPECLTVGKLELAAPTIKVYPNPFQDQVTIQNLSSQTEIYELRNINGSVIKQIAISGYVQLQLDLPVGFYYLRPVTYPAKQAVRMIKIK